MKCIVCCACIYFEMKGCAHIFTSSNTTLSMPIHLLSNTNDQLHYERPHRSKPEIKMFLDGRWLKNDKVIDIK